MTATAMSDLSAMASDLGDKIRTEGEKQLHKLEALAHPNKARALAKQRRRRIGKWTLLLAVAGVVYTMYRSMRDTNEEPFVKSPDVRTTKDVAAA